MQLELVINKCACTHFDGSRCRDLKIQPGWGQCLEIFRFGEECENFLQCIRDHGLGMQMINAIRRAYDLDRFVLE